MTLIDLVGAEENDLKLFASRKSHTALHICTHPGWNVFFTDESFDAAFDGDPAIEHVQRYIQARLTVAFQYLGQARRKHKHRDKPLDLDTKPFEFSLAHYFWPPSIRRFDNSRAYLGALSEILAAYEAAAEHVYLKELAKKGELCILLLPHNFTSLTGLSNSFSRYISALTIADSFFVSVISGASQEIIEKSYKRSYRQDSAPDIFGEDRFKTAAKLETLLATCESDVIRSFGGQINRCLSFTEESLENYGFDKVVTYIDTSSTSAMDIQDAFLRARFNAENGTMDIRTSLLVENLNYILSRQIPLDFLKDAIGRSPETALDIMRSNKELMIRLHDLKSVYSVCHKVLKRSEIYS